jgi:hypothetical protein
LTGNGSDMAEQDHSSPTSLIDSDSQAWIDFCDRLKAAGRIPLREHAPSAPADRAAGFRILARNIALGLLFKLENADPLNPELYRTYDTFRKQGGDNNDALYVFSPINGTDTYRISGKRGTANYFSIALVDDAPGSSWGGAVSCLLSGDEMTVGADGEFEVIISPATNPGNWMRSNPKTWRVLIRQFFADWENEEPMFAQIDRISTSELPTSELKPEAFRRGLLEAAAWVDQSIEYFAKTIEKWGAQPNAFISFHEMEKVMGATPGGTPLVCYWRLPPDEALIIRVKPPKARYWALEFGNHWFETMDYRYRLCSTNCHYAQLEKDGELIVVVEHQDPGLPNWLDTCGFSAGYLILRWMGADSSPTPVCQQVKHDTLLQHLPKHIRRITPEERKAQLTSRRKGALRRYGN